MEEDSAAHIRKHAKWHVKHFTPIENCYNETIKVA